MTDLATTSGTFTATIPTRSNDYRAAVARYIEATDDLVSPPDGSEHPPKEAEADG